MTHQHRSRGMRFFALFASAALVLGLAPAVRANAADPINLGVDRPVTASGQEVAGKWGPALAFDGDAGPEGSPVPPAQHNAHDASRWSSPATDNEWIQVDLGNTSTIQAVNIRWGNTYSTQYTLEGSADGSTWTTLATDAPGPTAKSGWTTWSGPANGVRYMKLSTSGGRNQPWGIGIWEIEVMGSLDGPVIEPAFVDVIPKPASTVETDAGTFQLDDSTPIHRRGGRRRHRRTVRRHVARLHRVPAARRHIR